MLHVHETVKKNHFVSNKKQNKEENDNLMLFA
jgi:hypothetical protein